MSTGIYILRFKNTSKVYIGQSTNLELRAVQHKSLFRAGNASQKMQEAFNTYGLPSMEVLVECEAQELDALEYEAISLYDSVNNGFNTRKSAGGGSNLWGELNGRSKYTNTQIIDAFFLLLQSPKLTYPKIFSMTGVPRPTLVDISNGTGHKWLGSMFPDEYTLLLSYRHKRNTRFYPKIMSPTGEIHTVEHLSNFCKKHGLDTGNLSKVLTGKKKQYLGWQVIAS
jgi:predicted GIY-YIG superfamily endonuclease